MASVYCDDGKRLFGQLDKFLQVVESALPSFASVYCVYVGVSEQTLQFCLVAVVSSGGKGNHIPLEAYFQIKKEFPTDLVTLEVVDAGSKCAFERASQNGDCAMAENGGGDDIQECKNHSAVEGCDDRVDCSQMPQLVQDGGDFEIYSSMKVGQNQTSIFRIKAHCNEEEKKKTSDVAEFRCKVQCELAGEENGPFDSFFYTFNCEPCYRRPSDPNAFVMIKKIMPDPLCKEHSSPSPLRAKMSIAEKRMVVQRAVCDAVQGICWVNSAENVLRKSADPERANGSNAYLNGSVKHEAMSVDGKSKDCGQQFFASWTGSTGISKWKLTFRHCLTLVKGGDVQAFLLQHLKHNHTKIVRKEIFLIHVLELEREKQYAKL